MIVHDNSWAASYHPLLSGMPGEGHGQLLLKDQDLVGSRSSPILRVENVHPLRHLPQPRHRLRTDLVHVCLQGLRQQLEGSCGVRQGGCRRGVDHSFRVPNNDPVVVVDSVK